MRPGYPNIFVSYKVADAVGKRAEYIRNKGLDDDICKQLIVKALATMGTASKQELFEVIQTALPESLNSEQKSKKLSNLLQSLRNDNVIETLGSRRFAKWQLVKKDDNHGKA